MSINPDLRGNLTLALLTILLAGWVYTEVTEYLERDAFISEVTGELDQLTAFKQAGGRFTQEDGKALEARIEALEVALDDD